MPTDAVWVIVTIPKKEYERELRAIKKHNFSNNNNNFDSDDTITEQKRQNGFEMSYERILSNTLDDLQIENVVWVPTRNGNYYQVYFPCDLYENDPILNALRAKGIGNNAETSVGYIPFTMFFHQEEDENDVDNFDDFYEYTLPGEGDGKKLRMPKGSAKKLGFKDAAKDFLESVTSRLTVAQVVEGVRGGTELNFDFNVYLLMAAFICSFALIANDAVNIGASMMIEGIMGTVTAMGFAVVIHDKSLFWVGFKNNIIACLISIFHGWWIGMIIFCWMHEWNPPPDGTWPTAQEQGRGTYWDLIYGVMIAFPCGGAIAVTLLHENSCALVGVALASTFMPPVVNCGQLWALSCHYQMRGVWQPMIPYNISGTIYHMKPAWAPQATYSPIYSYDMRIETALLGCVSIALTALNVLFLWLGCVIILWIKQVVPLEKMSPKESRFFNKDLKVYRQYQDRNAKLGNQEPLGKQILREWADITGVDKGQLLDGSTEARITRLQTLYDIAQDVEADDTYQRVLRNLRREDPRQGLVRRLTQPEIHEPNIVIHDNYRPVWSIEQELARLTGRKYVINQGIGHQNLTNDDSPNSTITSAQGFRPGDLKTEQGRRRSSAALRRTLRNSPHSPYSIYPREQSRANIINRASLTDTRRRIGHSQRKVSDMESTGF